MCSEIRHKSVGNLGIHDLKLISAVEGTLTIESLPCAVLANSKCLVSNWTVNTLFVSFMKERLAQCGRPSYI